MTDNFVTPIGDAPPSPPLLTLGHTTGFVATPVTDLSGRDTPTVPQIDIEYLAQVCARPSLLKNSSSPGASGLLKEFLYESGYVYDVEREIFKDHAEHQAGNAIDVSTEDAKAGGPDMGPLVRFIARVPELFSTVAYTDPNPIYSAESYYVHDGALVGLPTLTEPMGYLHLATTFQRFGAALKLATVRSGLALAGQGQFSNRDVYAVPTGQIGGAVSDPMVRFW